MPPIITLPPVVLDTVIPAVDDTTGAHFCGPFVIGAALYAVLLSEPTGAPPNPAWLNVYKSTNNGQSWTSLDTAHRPATNGEIFDVVLNGSVFTILYNVRITGILKIITFDTGTDTFGAPSVDGPRAAPTARIAQYANGDLCVAYDDFLAGTVATLIFSAGAWGAPVSIPNIKNRMAAVVMGANNIAQIFYYDLTPIPSFHIFLRTFTDGAVLGAEQFAFTGIKSIQRPFPIGRVVIWNGAFVIPVIGNPGGTQAGVWIGTPYTAPVWAFSQVDPNAQPPNAGDFTPYALTDTGGNLIVFWTTINLVIGFPNQVNMSYAVNAGTGFGAPQVFYDQLADPPVNPPVTPGPAIDIFMVSVTRYASGLFGVITSFCGCPTSQCIGASYLINGVVCPTNAQGN